MARQRANIRKLKLQRRYAVDEIRLREMNVDAHRRAAIVSGNPMEELFGSSSDDDDKRDRTYFKAVDLFRRQVKDLMGIMPDELPSDRNQRIRKFMGLEEHSVKTPRDESLWRMKLLRLVNHTEVIFRLNTKAMFLIQDENGYWYFLYREKGLYYKKSVFYDSRMKAMDRYEAERISWVEIFEE